MPVRLRNQHRWHLDQLKDVKENRGVLGEKPMHIVQVGAFGFPYGLAAIEKIRLLGRSLLEAGAEVSVISRKGVFDPLKGPHIPVSGEFEGIQYYYASGSIYRPSGFWQRNWLKLRGWWGEAKLLRKFSKEKRLDAIIVHSMNFAPVFFYWLLSRMYRFKWLYLLVEHNSTTTSRQTPLFKISDVFLENIGLRMADGVLPISQYLTKLLLEKAPGKPHFKIPVLTEFSRFTREKSTDRETFFLYCGSVSYLEIIFFVLDAFDRLTTSHHVKLYLVIGGEEDGKTATEKRISQLDSRDRIRTFSNLPYDQLVQLYIDAIGLLIPLRPTLQDEARFPHKIGEYLASGNPLITTRIGEVPFYFKDNENALVTSHYRVEEYVQKMQFILDHPERARQIGLAGRKTGLENFDYRQYGPPLLTFIKGLPQ